MPPSKRRTKGGRPVHRGRVTVPDDGERLARPSDPAPIDGPLAPAHRVTRTPPASSRYTPPTKSLRFRPGWNKILGFGLLILGVAIIVLNDAMMVQPSITLLPGGHTELYLIFGAAVAAYSTWWFGWFDRPR